MSDFLRGGSGSLLRRQNDKKGSQNRAGRKWARKDEKVHLPKVPPELHGTGFGWILEDFGIFAYVFCYCCCAKRSAIIPRDKLKKRMDFRLGLDFLMKSGPSLGLKQCLKSFWPSTFDVFFGYPPVLGLSISSRNGWRLGLIS